VIALDDIALAWWSVILVQRERHRLVSLRRGVALPQCST